MFHEKPVFSLCQFRDSLPHSLPLHKNTDNANVSDASYHQRNDGTEEDGNSNRRNDCITHSIVALAKRHVQGDFVLAPIDSAAINGWRSRS